jgi:hypothetical protein
MKMKNKNRLIVITNKEEKKETDSIKQEEREKKIVLNDKCSTKHKEQ